jgi:NAD(P)H-hydrate epimerase
MPEVMTAALAETDRGAISNEALSNAQQLASKSTVVAIGPGIGSSDERTREFVKEMVAQRTRPTIVDADGLNCLAPWPPNLKGSSDSPIILTPHLGEMRRLIQTDGIIDRLATTRSFAQQHNVILLLKGSRSIVAAPDGRIFINPTGNAGLGTAGAGDTLTGVIAGFLAQSFATLGDNADALETVLAALYISGLAGTLAANELGMRTMVASDIRERLSDAIRLLDPRGEEPPAINT